MVFSPIQTWFHQQGWTPFPFQLEAWQAIAQGKSGLLLAAPGTGKTYAILGGFCGSFLKQSAHKKGLRLLWITPLRALASDVTDNIKAMVDGIDLHWQVGQRTGDTKASEKAKQAKQLPEILVTTPESLHLLLSRPDCHLLFESLEGVVVDEWHELLGNKRGVQVELALAHLHGWIPTLQVWGISATIGNPQEALQVLCDDFIPQDQQILICSSFAKKMEIKTWIPSNMRRFPWAGHLGLQAIPALIPLIEAKSSTLIFTNTRAQAERWYQALLEAKPDWEKHMGIHHGSLEGEVRKNVEEGIHGSTLKVVVCTSSLDLGVDFHPVDQVIQIGSPKSIARCLQRAGRSGHRPGQMSSLLFVPTHALELIEAQALKHAIAQGKCEARKPLTLVFDVLVQYLLTLAVGEGFEPTSLYQEIKRAYAFRHLEPHQWQWLLHFLERGGEALQAYEDYRKIHLENGIYHISSLKQARRHRLSIGTMMSNASLPVRYFRGSPLGFIEEDFATRLKPGDVFWFNGKCLSFVYLREMTVWVRQTTAQPGTIPRWRGGRLPFSALLSKQLTEEIESLRNLDHLQTEETRALQPLLSVQQRWSRIPKHSELLIEKLQSKEGHHLFFYPFQGRMIHAAMAQLLAYRLSKRFPLSLSIAYNDYGFELLASQPIPFNAMQDRSLLSIDHLEGDLLNCLKKTELVKHHFREIARVSGLIFTGYPGKNIAQRHLQMSSELLFKVFEKYDPGNYLVQQSYREVLEHQWDLHHLRKVLQHLAKHDWILQPIRYPTPFAFPLFVEQWRDQLSSEQLEDRLEKMSIRLEQLADAF